MLKFQKGSKELLVLAAAAFLLIAFVLFFSQGKTQTQTTPQQTKTTIQSNSDLDNASKDMDSSDLDQIDKELNQLNTEFASF